MNHRLLLVLGAILAVVIVGPALVLLALVPAARGASPSPSVVVGEIVTGEVTAEQVADTVYASFEEREADREAFLLFAGAGSEDPSDEVRREIRSWVATLHPDR